MRVLHLTSSYPRHDGDPNGPYLAELVRAQAEAGLEPLVLAPHGPGLEEDGVVAGVPVHRFRYAPGRAERLGYRGSVLSAARHPLGAAGLPTFMAGFAAAAARQARTWRADVVHAHWWLPAGWAAVAAQRLSREAGGGPALVITCHGTDVHIARRSILRRGAGAVLRRADVVAAVSDALAADLRATVPGVVPVVLRMPFRAADAPAPTPAPRRSADAPVRVLAVGRVFPEKGYDVVVAAVCALAQWGGRVRLQIMGDGPMVPALRRMAEESNAGDLVSFVPSSSRQAMLAAVDASDAVVVPSRREGLGLVALDAMSRGKPVIASAVGGLVETLLGAQERSRDAAGIQETPLGLLVPPGDVAAWFAALGRLPLWPSQPDGGPPEPARDAAALVLGRHAADRVAKEHLEAYEEAMAARRVSR